jgi:signal transduction histidine kinase
VRLRSVRARAAVAVAALAVLLVTTTGLFLVLNARQRLEAQLEEDARLFASLATRPICESYEVYFESGFYKFRQFVAELLEQTPDVVAIEVLDVEGRVLFDSRRPRGEEADAGPRTLAGPKLEATRGLQPVLLRGDDDDTFEIVQPFLEDWGRHRLAVSYYVSHAHVEGQLQRYALATLALSVGSLVLAGFVAWALASRVTRSLEALTQGARRLAEGDLEHRLDVQTGDEIQVLAEAFNEMATRLQATINDLERRNLELERFTYTVSHDLRSPLVTVKGFLGVMEKDIEGGDLARVKDDISRIRTATETMERLLRELLELSRVERVAAPPERVPLGELVREATRLVEGRLTSRGIRLEIAPDLPVIYGDRARLREVVQNLLDNAAKFMGDQPEPRIEVGWRDEPEGPVCTVGDNGIGIEPRYHDRIFGLFDRLDPSTDGTGLGLALVQRVIQMHEGRVWVESEGRGHGSTFCFTVAPAPVAGEGVGVSPS